MLRVCVEPGCGVPSDQTRCPDHRRAAWASSDRKDRRQVSGWTEQRRAKRILAKYLTCCHVCGKPGADQVDHVIPLAEGGADEDHNLAPIHAEPCHREKTAREARRAVKRS